MKDAALQEQQMLQNNKIAFFLDGLVHKLAAVQQNLATAAACLDRAAVAKRDLRGLIDLVHRFAKLTVPIINLKHRLAGQSPAAWSKLSPGQSHFPPSDLDEGALSCSSPEKLAANLFTAGSIGSSGNCFLSFLLVYAGEFTLQLNTWHHSSEALVQTARSYEALRCVSLETENTLDRLIHNIRGLLREIKNSLDKPESALRHCCSCRKPCLPDRT